MFRKMRLPEEAAIMVQYDNSIIINCEEYLNNTNVDEIENIK
jgi:hypothetical protein